ncbi:DUF3143 domain-containing protein [Merismopedia glauca]|uniref:DUF3143 domain-containing protein n=1 Tax=Merismopedia glauca CCAP 1448/3 TaxID=1296344 RepID=A0A2T1C8M7_9CYAN|nr:DUF3143 domain-containing protein [Merismopedia glauca]PSB04493.1 DUF3143 domain-containing protein [Merismopedia glauca CCAP 1448/3]
MELPAPETPLYSHTLPQIEMWLTEQGCQQDPQSLNSWRIEAQKWQAELVLEIEELVVCYLDTGEQGDDLYRSFRYSLSRQDIQDAVFAGP